MHRLQHIAELAPLLESLGGRHVIIAPGSRNAPLIQLFTSQKNFVCHSIVDERSAGYVALGMAKQLGEPVVLVTTSGTAVLNLSPALAEAHQQQLPLIVLTADRPREIISSFNNQVFDQRAPYFNFSKGFFEFPGETRETDDLEKAMRSAGLLFREALAYPPGPVHVNLPLNEPLYEPLPDPILDKDLITSDVDPISYSSDSRADITLKGKKAMILAGMGRTSPGLRQVLEQLGVLVVAENISNLASEQFISLPELVLAGASEQEREGLKPELVITFGQQVVSKRLKLFLQSTEGMEVLELEDPGPGLIELFGKLAGRPGPDTSFRNAWKAIENRQSRKADDYLNRCDFGNLSAMARILQDLPPQTIVHLGNSATIRLSQLVPARPDLQYYSNRGISGIDGCFSSAVGAAMVSKQQHLLVLGDLSFVYDSNALWNKDYPENLKIVVLNDGGGGIFRLLDGPDRMGFFEEFSVTHHPVSLELLATAFGRTVSRVSSMEELEQRMPMLWAGGHGLSVLEVDTTQSDNRRIYKNLFK